MKIALCLSGLLGGLNGKNGLGKQIDPRNGYYWFKKNIIQNNHVDVFIHSWGNINKDLISLYDPKKTLFEKQKYFNDSDFKLYGCNSYEELFFRENIDRNIAPTDQEIIELKDQIFRSSSKWYSLSKSIELKKEYERINNFQYDFVVLSRFDIALTKKINFNKLNKNIIYLSDRGSNQELQGSSFNDLIFLGDSKIINSFSQIFKKRGNYSIDPINSCYQHINQLGLNWESFFEYNKDTYVLRWNQHLMNFSPQPYFLIKHHLREIKRKLKNARF